MDSELGAWLRQQREDRGWPKAEMARRLVQAGHEAGDKSMPSAERHAAQHPPLGTRGRRLRAPQAPLLPRPRHPRPASSAPASRRTAGRRSRCRARPWQSPPPVARPGAAQRSGRRPRLAGPRLPASAAVAYRGRQEPDMGDFAVEREVLMAAHEGSDHAEEHEQHGIGEATFEQLRADVVRLSRLSDTGAPLPGVPGHAPGPRPDLPAAGPAAVAARADRPVLPARLPQRADGHHREPARLPRRGRGADPGRLGLRASRSITGRCWRSCASSCPTSPTGAAGSPRASDLAVSGLRVPGRRAGRPPTCTSTTPARGQARRRRHRPPGGRRTPTRRATATTATTCWRSAASSPSHWPPTTPWPGPRSPTSRAPKRDAATELERASQPLRPRPRARRAALVRRQAAGRHRPGHRPAPLGRARRRADSTRASPSPCPPSSGSPTSPPGWPRSAANSPRRSSGARRRHATSVSRSRSSAARLSPPDCTPSPADAPRPTAPVHRPQWPRADPGAQRDPRLRHGGQGRAGRRPPGLTGMTACGHSRTRPCPGMSAPQARRSP